MTDPNQPASGSAANTGAAELAAETTSEAQAIEAEASLPGLSAAFPVVGVGASAGGLEALDAFLGRLPRTGMAYVVIQHLSPDKESRLPEILARATRLPVVAARRGGDRSAASLYAST